MILCERLLLTVMTGSPLSTQLRFSLSLIARLVMVLVSQGMPFPVLLLCQSSLLNPPQLGNWVRIIHSGKSRHVHPNPGEDFLRLWRLELGLDSSRLSLLARGKLLSSSCPLFTFADR
jgi:hypothetical protein